MTNNPTIDGVSLKLIQDAVNGNRQESREAIRELREFLRNQIDAPAVERQEHKPSQVSVLRAMAANYRNGHSWDLLDGEAVSKAADEITAQVSTIARLEARIAELESGRGEPVARDQQVTELSEFMGRLSGGLRHFAGQIIDAGWVKSRQSQNVPIGFRDPEFSWATISAENKTRMTSLGHDMSCFSLPLFTAPPAPVAVVLPERAQPKSWNKADIANCDMSYIDGWNACLDATAALNGVKS